PARRAVLLAGAALAAVLVLLGVWYFAVRDPVNPQASGNSSSGGGEGGTGSGGGDRGAGGGGGGPRGGPPGPGGRPPPPAGRPAAGVDAASARCTQRAECWSGPVLISGEVHSIRRLPCDQEHSWETYAIAPVPPGVASPFLDVLESDETVQRVCATEVLLAS